MDISAFEDMVLGSCNNDYEAPHTVASDLARDLNRPVTEVEVRAAFLALTSKGLVQAYSERLEPISTAAAHEDEAAWFMMNDKGRKWYENEAS